MATPTRETPPRTFTATSNPTVTGATVIPSGLIDFSVITLRPQTTSSEPVSSPTTSIHPPPHAPATALQISLIAAVVLSIIAAALVIILVIAFLYARHRVRNLGNSPRSEAPSRFSTYIPDDRRRSKPIPYPPQIHNKDILRDVAALSAKIEEHIESFYDFEVKFYDTRLDPRLVSRRTRPVALRETVARALLGRIEPRGDPNTTLLPRGLVEITRDLPHEEDRPSECNAVLPQALSQFRSLTAFLLQYGDEFGPSGYHTKLSHAIHNGAMQIFSDLDRFIEKSNKDRARDHMIGLLEKTAQLGALIISQPVVWEFGGWKSREGDVVFPALLRKSDERGQRLDEPVVVRTADVVQSEGLSNDGESSRRPSRSTRSTMDGPSKEI